MAGDQKKFQVAMARAEQLSEQKQWAEASKAYRFALAEFPNNEAAIIGFGRASLFSGQQEFALRAFQQVLKINPMNQQALAYIGDIQEQSGQAEAAAETYLRLGNMSASKFDFEVAIDHWSHAVELVPNKIEAHRKLIEGFTQQEQPRLAARQLLALAAVHQQQNNPDSAMGLIQEAEALVSDDPGIAAAKQSLQSGAPIQPEAISETPPEPTSETDFFDSFLEMDAFEEDPFAVEEFTAQEAPRKGLVGAAQEKALADLANVVFDDNGTPQNTMLIIQAIDLQGKGKLSEAANNYHQVMQAGMQHSALYFNLGLLWKELGQLNQALEMLNVAAQDSQYNLSARFALGEIYHAAGKLDSALKHFVEVVKAVDLRTVTGHAAQEIIRRYDGLVNDYLAQGDVERINTFILTLENFFKHPAWEKKAFEARQLMDGISEDNNTMSLAEYLEAPQTEVVISAMALTNQYLNRNMLMTASEESLRAIQNAPMYLPLHMRLADILLKQGRTDEAIAKYLYIAKVHQTRATPELSVDIYQKVLDLAPMDVKVRASLIDIYISLGSVEQALEQYLILADSYYQLAQVDKSLEKYNEALRLANKAGANNWKINILGRVGDICTQRFDWAGATRAYEEMNKLKPNDERIQRRLIDFYYKQNRIKEAITTLDNLLDFYQRQQPLKTVELLKDLSANNPDDLTLRQRLAIAYAQNGMTQEAIAEYDALGEMQLENGLRNEAIQTIQAILNLGPEDPEGYRRLLAQLGGGAVG